MKTIFNPLKITVLSLLLIFFSQLFNIQAAEQPIKTSTGSSIEVKKSKLVKIYKVKSYLKEYDNLDKELKTLIINKLADWDLQPPLDDIFIIESGRFEKTWGIITFRAKDKYDTGELVLSKENEVDYGAHKQLIYSKDTKGNYIGAFKNDPNLIVVLDSISNEELSMQAKIIAWDYPADKNMKQSMAAAAPSIKFPWQVTTPYRISQTWHQDGFGKNAIDVIPVNNNDLSRKIISPLTGVVSDICRGVAHTYIIIKTAGSSTEYSLLHLSTSTVPSKLIPNANITQGEELGSIYNGPYNQTGLCRQRADGTHLHINTNSPSKNMNLDGYTFTSNSLGGFKLLDRNNNEVTSVFTHNLISTQLSDKYSSATNCQNGISGSYCLDRPSAHIIKGTISSGINSSGKAVLRVEVRKVDGGKFTTAGKMKIFDTNRNAYISKLDSSINATAGKSEIPYSTGGSSIVFYIDPTYLNMNETTNLSIRLLSSNGSTMYVDYFRITKSRG